MDVFAAAGAKLAQDPHHTANLDNLRDVLKKAVLEEESQVSRVNSIVAIHPPIPIFVEDHRDCEMTIDRGSARREHVPETVVCPARGLACLVSANASTSALVHLNGVGPHLARLPVRDMGALRSGELNLNGWGELSPLGKPAVSFF